MMKYNVLNYKQMKKTTLIVSLLIISCSYSAKGQDTITSYFNHKWKKCGEELAVYYRKVYPDSSGMWIMEDYHMNGQLQMLGQYSDKKLKKQQGWSTFYHFNGNVSALGQYLDNKRVGIWKKYYTSGGLAAEGKMLNDKQDSTWIYYHINGPIFGERNYVKGKAEGESRWYYESGKISEIAVYKQGEITRKINYDEEGNIIKTVKEDSEPEFDTMYLFIRNNLKYPEELRLKGKQGVVMFHFIVRKDGSIDNVEYKKSDEPLFNEEALRVFDVFKRIKPAYQHGQIMDRECTMPIIFRLQ